MLSSLLAAEDGTAPEDLALYLADLGRYRLWRLREAPEPYLGRLERLLLVLDEDVCQMEGLAAVSLEEAGPSRGYGAQGLWHLFHALVAFLEGTKWLHARELPPGVFPGSFSESVSMLTAAGILSAEHLASYKDLCRLRNRLAHEWDWLPTDVQVRDLLTRHAPVLRHLVASQRARYLA